MHIGADIFVDWQQRDVQALPKVAAHADLLQRQQDDDRRRAHRVRSPRAGTHRRRYLCLPPASNVLVTGDVLTVGTYPIADYTTGGWLGGC